MLVQGFMHLAKTLVNIAKKYLLISGVIKIINYKDNGENKMKKQIIAGLMLSGLALSVVGCSPKASNPLVTSNADDAAQFLVKASNYAEVKINKHFGDNGYLQCMNRQKDKATCYTLFKYMVRYAKSSPQFKNITVDDLTENPVWKKLEPRYKEIVFDTLQDEVDKLN